MGNNGSKVKGLLPKLKRIGTSLQRANMFHIKNMWIFYLA